MRSHRGISEQGLSRILSEGKTDPPDTPGWPFCQPPSRPCSTLWLPLPPLSLHPTPSPGLHEIPHTCHVPTHFRVLQGPHGPEGMSCQCRSSVPCAGPLTLGGPEGHAAEPARLPPAQSTQGPLSGFWRFARQLDYLSQLS